MFERERTVVVVPAFNEESTVGSVVEAAINSDPKLVDTDYVIVVDNMSIDETASVAQAAGATVLSCDIAQGKAPSMQVGAIVARALGAKAVTFLDADLIGLRPDHISSLSQPVLEGEASMTIGYLGHRTRLAKLIYKRWGMFSGQRTILLDHWFELGQDSLVGFRAESGMNSLYRNAGRGDEIQRFELEGLSHVGKFEKFGVMRGLVRYAHIEGSAIIGLATRSSL